MTCAERQLRRRRRSSFIDNIQEGARWIDGLTRHARVLDGLRRDLEARQCLLGTFNVRDKVHLMSR